MKFTDMLKRITGISCPIFGVSWEPPEFERDTARRIIIFLEPRRVLYAPLGVEALCSSINSVTKIKDYLTKEIQQLNDESALSTYTRAMRKACNKFLSTFPDRRDEKCIYCKAGSDEYQIFMSSIGELRTLFGIMIGQISKAFGLDIEDDLAQIIPE